jgi:hypothetical protein
LDVGSKEYFIDLLLFHRRSLRLVLVAETCQGASKIGC